MNFQWFHLRHFVFHFLCCARAMHDWDNDNFYITLSGFSYLFSVNAVNISRVTKIFTVRSMGFLPPWNSSPSDSNTGLNFQGQYMTWNDSSLGIASIGISNAESVFVASCCSPVCLSPLSHHFLSLATVVHFAAGDREYASGYTPVYHFTSDKSFPSHVYLHNRCHSIILAGL